MTARRLEPTGAYHGPIWGLLPTGYPTEQAERVYRYLLDQMPAEARARALMGHGFKGVAYRFRAAMEYQVAFERSFFGPGGTAPPTDDHYHQERALYGFFLSGLACIESFAFAIHALAAFYCPDQFGLSEEHLRKVTPRTITAGLVEVWPSALLTRVTGDIARDEAFRVWKEIRNVLSHRVVPARAIIASPESRVKSTWQLTDHQFLDRDEPLEAATGPRGLWLQTRVCDLWDGVEQSFPPL